MGKSNDVFALNLFGLDVVGLYGTSGWISCLIYVGRKCESVLLFLSLI